MSDPGDESEGEDEGSIIAPGAANVAEPQKIAERNKRLRRPTEEQKRLEFWKGVFADPIGRSEMWAILASGHAFEERFATGPNGMPQPEASWCYAGEQRLAFRLYLSWMKLCPDGVQRMIAEHHAAFIEKPKPKRA